MAWTTAVSDLRIVLNDGPTDKLYHRKKVFGDIDGNNTAFKTFEFRRVTDFTEADAPLGVYIDGVRQDPGQIADDDLISGEFNLVSAPTQNSTDASVVECTYYVQWFLDSELASFLTFANDWLGVNADYSEITLGLRPAAKKYAEYEAYRKLSLKYAQKLSETYRLEDGEDDKRMEIVKAYQDAAQSAYKDAVKQRDDFYSRQGQSNAPLFVTNRGTVKETTPRR